MAHEERGELTIVTKAKELCEYVMTVTQKSPKAFRYTYVSRLQNLSLSIIENIYRANETYVGGKNPGQKYYRRLDFQHAALTDIKLLTYFAGISMKQGVILLKQYEVMSRLATDCQYLLGAWITSDKKRIKEKYGEKKEPETPVGQTAKEDGI